MKSWRPCKCRLSTRAQRRSAHFCKTLEYISIPYPIRCSCIWLKTWIRSWWYNIWHTWLLYRKCMAFGLWWHERAQFTLNLVAANEGKFFCQKSMIKQTLVKTTSIMIKSFLVGFLLNVAWRKGGFLFLVKVQTTRFFIPICSKINLVRGSLAKQEAITLRTYCSKSMDAFRKREPKSRPWSWFDTTCLQF